MTTLPSRAQIGRAPALEFPEKASRQDLTITVRAVVDSFPIEVCFSGSIDQLLSVTKRLRELGGTPTIAPASTAPLSGGTQPARKPAQKPIEPWYNDKGETCCPVHRRPLSLGQYGMYCSSKTKPGEEQNDKGYCSLRFAE